MEDRPGTATPRPRRSGRRLLVAAAMVLAGTVWILQGLGILTGGSFMVGDPLWASIGSIVAGVGLGLAWRERREWRQGG